MINGLCPSDLKSLILSFFGLTDLLFLAIIIAGIWSIRLTKRRKGFRKVLKLAILTSLHFVTIAAIIILVFGLFLEILIFREEYYDSPIAEKYFSLNAAIKNTCYLDSNRLHCPKDLKELIAIEPQKFVPLTYGKGLTYQYYPETNEYTLVVRDDLGKGVVFDPRLKTESGYGFDFLDIRISGCFNIHFVEGSLFSIDPWKSAFENYIRNTGFNRKIN